MGKLALILTLFCSMVIATPLVHGVDEGPQAVEEWFKNLSHEKEKVTKLHFYLHEKTRGKNPTAVKVAQANFTSNSSTLFGSVGMVDDLVLTGPEPNSTAVGRAQGIAGGADLEEVGLLMTINFVFTSGKYNGSTLSVLGRNPIFRKYQELPIVGGSGFFRLARGIVTTKTYALNATSGIYVAECSLIVLHY